MNENSGIFLFFYLAVCVLIIVSTWKIFEKANRPGWQCLIPVYDAYVLLKISGLSGLWLIAYFIPVVNFFAIIYTYYKLAQAFGKGIGFTAGLIFLTVIFIPILAFGDAEYQLDEWGEPKEEDIEVGAV